MGQYAGLEHDSGWYLGVAKNLADRGIYASYTNTITEEGTGAHPSIHGRFSVQDNKGFSYFPAAVTAGPGYVIPEALLLKFFGNGWLQYRLWPLIAYIGLLFLLFFITWKIGGIFSLIILELWLWIVPQTTIQFAYEALSEDIALLYLLIGFILYHFTRYQYKEKKVMFISGLFISFSLLTKNIFLLPSLAFIGPFLFEFRVYYKSKKIREFSLRWAVFFLGIVLPIISFELYRYLFLVFHFGISSWFAINQDILLTFHSGGSGIDRLNLLHMDWLFVFKKINIWMDVGIKYPVILWIIIFSFPIIFFELIEKPYRVFVCMLYVAMIISFLWFVLLSTTGWTRHVWQAVIIGMLIVSIILGKSFSLIKNMQVKLLFVVVVIAGFLGIVNFQSVNFSLFLNTNSIERWQLTRYMRGVLGLPSNNIPSLKEQNNLITFFSRKISPRDRIYYDGFFLNAEISPLVDKVFYPLDRYTSLGMQNPDGGGSYLIFGPYQQGLYSLEPEFYLAGQINQFCNLVVYQNASYTLCLLKNNETSKSH